MLILMQATHRLPSQKFNAENIEIANLLKVSDAMLRFKVCYSTRRN
jgi:hypothetical protein